jgi:hypothetical protein
MKGVAIFIFSVFLLAALEQATCAPLFARHSDVDKDALLVGQAIAFLVGVIGQVVIVPAAIVWSAKQIKNVMEKYLNHQQRVNVTPVGGADLPSAVGHGEDKKVSMEDVD